LAFDHEGNLFIADSINDRIRQVDPSGTITTIAGDGQRDFRGDGATARLASLNLAAGPGTGGAIAVDDAGRLYLVDGLNNRIRVVDLSGVISTVAGTGAVGYAGSGTSALASELNLPLGVAIDAAGRVYIADTVNNLVRVLR
jgi:sugar lactone lactonase YvrE